ncbi:type II secretion system F family protein [Clostridium sp. Marseille-P299]|uniref:type II secretion system F family protein n=1 Tax=Clostridium sp. Marseille-P299 TaxID=1805477 RepID=UPI00082D46E6|nr:type II secretion system F family protein [Clostridium sp. Marseille-P299]
MNREVKKNKEFSSEELSVFCEQIAMLLNSGIPLYDGIDMLYQEMEDKKTKEVLERLTIYMKDNMSLHEALLKVESFPEYMIHMVKVGEYSGKLEEVMHSLAAYYERETNVKVSIRNAITYPIILYCMMSIIILTLVWKILPLFENMFLELNAEISATTKQMMTVGITAGTVIAIITCIIMVFIVVTLLWKRTKHGDKALKNLVRKIRFTNKLSEEIAIGKFISGMSLMISSGINMDEALEIVKDITDHNKVKEKIVACQEKVKENIPIEEAIKETGLIAGMESRMISVAGKTGATDSAFSKLSEQYNVKTTNKLSRLSTMIETILVVCLTVMVGGVLISVMLPLVSMISSVG